MDESFRLFSLGRSISGTPRPLDSSTFQTLGALELQHIERWVQDQPDLLGEDLLVVSTQFAEWDRTKERLDVLLLDRSGLVVIAELKRDDSGSSPELQAIKYAAFASTLTAERVVEIYCDYRGRLDDEVGIDEGFTRLREFVTDGSLARLDDDDIQPRIILAARSFRPDVTASVLWLRRFGLDITCVQLTPFEIGGEVVLASTVLIPLKEAQEFEVRARQKRAKPRNDRSGTPMDFERAKAFIGSIPEGRWSSYGDVAAAAGNAQGAQAVGNWLNRSGEELPRVYRVLRKAGEVSEGWNPAKVGLPQTPDAVRTQLTREGISFDNLRADPLRRYTADEWEPESVGGDVASDRPAG